MNVDRLSNHTNADDQRVYRSEEEIAAVRLSGDPVLMLREELIARGTIGEAELLALLRSP